jgi:hypothetical protein
MFTNWDARDAGSLEDVFRSRHFGRAAGAMGGRRISGADVREDALFAKEFGRPVTAVPSRGVEGEREPRLLASKGRHGATRSQETEVPEQPRQVEPSGGGAGSGSGHAEARSAGPSSRRTPRYGMIASITALAALVAAGVMAGVDHHPRSAVSAQGKHDTAHPRSGEPNPGPASAGPTASSGSPTASAGSGGSSSGGPTNPGLRSGAVPTGRVSLVGPATYSVTPGSPAASGGSPGSGNSATASPPAPGNAGPAAPDASAAGSAVSAVGASVAAATGQLGSSVPAAATATGVANSIVNTLDQTVSAATE